jgi:carboxypeptidase D
LILYTGHSKAEHRLSGLGPGCSSFDGALLEVGPITVQGKGSQATLRDNPGKWNEYANVLFVDQPAGTGYSYINKGQAVRELAPVSLALTDWNTTGPV